MCIFTQIADMLTKEKENNLQMQKQFAKEIAELPKGSIISRKVGSGEYFYLTYHHAESKKSTSKYVGKDKAIVSAVQEQIERRKRLEKAIRGLEVDLDAIEKMLIITTKRLKQKSVREKLEEIGASQDAITVPQPQPQATDVQKANEQAFIEQQERERK